MRATALFGVCSALLVLAGCGAPTASSVSPASGTAARPPDFELPRLDGGTERLSDHFGKDVVLIDFWATFCKPCLKAMPDLDALYEQQALQADRAKREAMLHQIQRQLHERASRELATVVPVDARTWCQIDEVVAIGRPYEVILQQARDTAADLIVMGAHGRAGLDLHVLGSTTDHVVRESTCPVLTVRR